MLIFIAHGATNNLNLRSSFHSHLSSMPNNSTYLFSVIIIDLSSSQLATVIVVLPATLFGDARVLRISFLLLGAISATVWGSRLSVSRLYRVKLWPTAELYEMLSNLRIYVDTFRFVCRSSYYVPTSREAFLKVVLMFQDNDTHMAVRAPSSVTYYKNKYVNDVMVGYHRNSNMCSKLI